MEIQFYSHGPHAVRSLPTPKTGGRTGRRAAGGRNERPAWVFEQYVWLRNSIGLRHSYRPSSGGTFALIRPAASLFTRWIEAKLTF